MMVSFWQYYKIVQKLIKQNHSMTTSLLLAALDTENYSQANEILSSEGFFYSITPQSLPLIKLRLFNRQTSLPNHIKLLLIACLLINQATIQTNQKKQLVEWLIDEVKSGSFKEVAAGLVIRINNFQNYHTVLNHLHPSTVPLNILIDKSAQIRAKRPTAFDNHILKFRQQWVLLLNGTQFSLKNLINIIQEFKDLDSETNAYQVIKKLEGEVKYLTQRIKNLTVQKINLEEFCHTIQKCIEAQNQNVKGLEVIHDKFKALGFHLLNQFLTKVQRRFIRKYHWLLRLVTFGFQNFSSPTSSIQVLKLLNTTLKVFGNGSFDIQNIIFKKTGSIIQLLEDLLLKRDDDLFRMQASTNSQIKSKQFQLQIKQSQDPFRNFVKLVKSHQKTEMINHCLRIILKYCEEPHDTTYIVKLFEVVDQHKLSAKNKEVYEKIKVLMFPRNIVYSPNLQQIYEQIITQQVFSKKMQSQDTIKKKRQIDRQPLLEDKKSDSIRMIQSHHDSKNWDRLLQSRHQNKPPLVRQVTQSNVAVDYNNSKHSLTSNMKQSFSSFKKQGLQQSLYSPSQFQSYYQPAGGMKSSKSDVFKSYHQEFPDLLPRIQPSQISYMKNSIPEEGSDWKESMNNSFKQPQVQIVEEGDDGLEF